MDKNRMNDDRINVYILKFIQLGGRIFYLKYFYFNYISFNDITGK